MVAACTPYAYFRVNRDEIGLDVAEILMAERNNGALAYTEVDVISHLVHGCGGLLADGHRRLVFEFDYFGSQYEWDFAVGKVFVPRVARLGYEAYAGSTKIGRASCRERV